MQGELFEKSSPLHPLQKLWHKNHLNRVVSALTDGWRAPCARFCCHRFHSRYAFVCGRPLVAPTKYNKVYCKGDSRIAHFYSKVSYAFGTPGRSSPTKGMFTIVGTDVLGGPRQCQTTLLADGVSVGLAAACVTKVACGNLAL